MVRLSRCAVLGVLTVTACARAPSPLVPAWHGSIGTPVEGVLADGAELPSDGQGMRWLRANDRHWGSPRFTEAIANAAARVAHDRPGAMLYAGDLSTRSGGGPLPPHFSHRSGADADLLFYLTTLEDEPVDSPGFIHVGADGIAHDEAHGRWLRLDVDREWRLVEALVEDRRARVQWIFVSDVVKAMLIEWAFACGAAIETIARADEVMRQPHPGGVHDDHIHVRTTCSPDEIVAGCEPSGPRRAWLSYEMSSGADRDDDLALALLLPLDGRAETRAAGTSVVKSDP